MKEYEFRFPGLDPLRDHARARRLRDCLVEIAGGFTEIPEGVLGDLLPGAGAGYIMALPDEASRVAIEALLAHLAAEWSCPSPRLRRASEGPRREVGFFLIPALANRDKQGYRRPLFSRRKWSAIRESLSGKLSHPVIRVYGEWKSVESGRQLDKDVSFMFIFPCASEHDALYFERFIERDVFDGGRECDQATIYLSARGDSRLVVDPSWEP